MKRKNEDCRKPRRGSAKMAGSPKGKREDSRRPQRADVKNGLGVHEAGRNRRLQEDWRKLQRKCTEGDTG